MVRISSDTPYEIARYAIEAGGILLLLFWFGIIGLLAINDYMDFAAILVVLTLLVVVIGFVNESGMLE